MDCIEWVYCKFCHCFNWTKLLKASSEYFLCVFKMAHKCLWFEILLQASKMTFFAGGKWSQVLFYVYIRYPWCQFGSQCCLWSTHFSNTLIFPLQSSFNIISLRVRSMMKQLTWVGQLLCFSFWVPRTPESVEWVPEFLGQIFLYSANGIQCVVSNLNTLIRRLWGELWWAYISNLRKETSLQFYVSWQLGIFNRPHDIYRFSKRFDRDYIAVNIASLTISSKCFFRFRRKRVNFLDANAHFFNCWTGQVKTDRWNESTLFRSHILFIPVAAELKGRFVSKSLC
jgi:hypothetical protein